MAFWALDIAKTALFAQQTGLQVTSHNIANVNTPGYSKQGVTLAPYTSIPFPFGSVGRGVKVEGIRRFYDRFLTLQLDRQQSTKSYWEARNEILRHLEDVFNETDDRGLSRAMDQFWRAWHDLALNPQGYAERVSLIGVAKGLAENINYKVRQLIDVEEDLEGQITLVVQEVNRLATEVARLNVQIVESEARGQGANDLRDERDRLIRQLSEYVNCSVFEDDYGRVSVLIGGSPLVEGASSSWRMEAQEVAAEGRIHIYLVSGSGTRVEVTSQVTGGKLGGLLGVRNSDLVGVRQQLDNFARALIYQVNRLHSQGEGLQRYTQVTGTIRVDDPTVPLASAGLPFEVQSGSFWIRVFGTDGTLVREEEIAVDPASQSLEDLASVINAAFSGEVTATVTDGRLQLEAGSGYELSFAREDGSRADSSGALAALGVNAFFTGYDALTIGVNSALEASPNLIAAAAYSDTAGDNTNALAIAELEGQAVLEGTTLRDYYASLVGGIAVGCQDSERRLEFEEAMLQSLENRRSEISGVSLDEEMINLMKFQRAYEAAAKVISVVDEMLATLISLR